MSRARWGVASKKRRKRILKQAKGNYIGRRLHLRKVKETVMRAKRYSTRDRKVRKREYRSLWIIRLNAAARARGLTYGQFMSACKKSNIQLNRNQLSELAVNDPSTFDQLVAQVTAVSAK